MKFFSALDTNKIFDDRLWHNFVGDEMSFSTNSGRRVNADVAMCIGAVYAGTRLIAETMGMLPLNTLRRFPNGGKEKDREHRLHELLQNEPNRWQDPMQFREMLTGHAVLRGGGFAEIVAGPRGFADRLEPLHPASVTPKLTQERRLVYEVRESGHEIRMLTDDQMLHIRGFGDGVRGISLISAMRETLGRALAAEEHAARFFGQGAEPGSVLKHPAELSEDAQKRLKKSWDRRNSGVENHHSMMVLEENMDWVRVGFSAKDSQLIEVLKFAVTQIATFLRLPPHILGDLEKATFSNITEQDLELVKYSLMPWAKRWESATQRRLVLPTERDVILEFNMDALLRADIKTRFEAYRIAIEMGILSRNEVRELENRNPKEGGDELLQPLNMATVEGMVGDVSTETRTALKDMDTRVAALVNTLRDSIQENRTPVIPTRAFSVVRSAAERIIRREISALEKWAPRYEGKDKNAWHGWLNDWYEKHAGVVGETLFISQKQIRKYCEAQKSDVLDQGHRKATGQWLNGRIDELAQMIMNEGEAA